MNYNSMQGCPNSGDSLESLCWPIVKKEPLPVYHQPTHEGHQASGYNDVRWPVAEPWRRNVGQPRCMGQGRCQGDAQRCNSKYRYGVDDVGRCPTHESCKTSYSCRNEHVNRSQACPRPCAQPETCNRLTTRCYEWPVAKRETCPPANPNMDHKPPRPDLMDVRLQPECCPTCHRTLVDIQSGPLGMNY